MDYIQAILGMVCLGLIKMVDLTDADNIFYARCAFACGASLALLALATLYLRITSTNDAQSMVITNAELNPPPPFAAMMGAPADPYDNTIGLLQPDDGSWTNKSDANKQAVVTHKEYDLVQLRKLAQSTITPLCITLALHLYKGFMPPIVLQSVIPVAGIMGSQLAKIHLLGGNAAKGELKRPWKASSPFAAFKDLGKEMKQLSSGETKAARKNKKAENMKKTR